MRPSRRASAVAWVLVAFLVAALGVQAWPHHPDPAGFRSHISVNR